MKTHSLMRRLLFTTLILAGTAPGGGPGARAETAAVVVAKAGAAPSPAPAALPPAGAELEDFVRRYAADEGDTAKFYDLAWSEARFDRLERLQHDWQAKLKTVDFDALGQAGRVDYLLLQDKLAEELAHLELDRRRLREMDELLPFRPAVQALELARRRMQPVNARAGAEALAGIPAQIKGLRARIEQGRSAKPDDKAGKESKDTKDAKKAKAAKEREARPLKVSPVLARRTAEAVGALNGALRAWEGFYEGFQPDFGWWVKKPADEAAKALEEYAKFLREEIAGSKGREEDPLVGDPIGAAGLADDLAAERIPYTPKELIAIGEREFAWCEGEMKKAAAEMGFGTDWKAALAKVKGDYAPPGGQDELVTGYARQSIAFLKQNDLVTIPPLCEETWRLTMSSPEVQKTLPFAAYGGQSMLVAYAKEEMKNEDKLMAMRGNNRAFTHIVVPHELIPGHHLQMFQSERNRPYRSLFRTPFYVEGWALYWELRYWDLGWSPTPPERIGMLFWRMHRCARIIVSLKFHLGEMTPPQMIDFLVDRVGHERFGATSEVRRFIGGAYSPLYQCGYLLGGMQLWSLHAEIVDSGKMTERQFNDAVLAANTMPIEMVRATLLNQPLTRDQKPAWRFAEGRWGGK